MIECKQTECQYNFAGTIYCSLDSRERKILCPKNIKKGQIDIHFSKKLMKSLEDARKGRIRIVKLKEERK